MLPETPSQQPSLSDAKRRLLEQRLRGKASSTPSRDAIRRRSSPSGPAPLSFAQQRLWFLHQLDPGSVAYNLPKVIRVQGRLDPPHLARVLSEIVRRHEILRTTFAEVDGQPRQVVSSAGPLPLPEIDLRRLPQTERQACLRRLAAEEGSAPFDLARGPLLRARIVTLSEEEHVLLFTLHHIVSDGWSTGVLVRELGAFYRAFAAGAPSPLPELPIQYADFAEWERRWLQGEVLRTRIAYWKEKLAGVPVLDLPTDRPRAAELDARGERRSFDLTPRLSESLKALARAEGTTVFTVLIAAYKVLLHRYTGQEDFCVGSPIAGRVRIEVEPLIGFFVNTLVLRTDLSGAPAFRKLLARVRETVLGAHDHQELPFEKLVEVLAPERRLNSTPLFQVMFSLLGSLGEAVELPGLRLVPIEMESRLAKFDLALAMIQRGDHFTSSFEYRTGLFDAATIGRTLEHWATLLAGIVADPDTPISELPLLGEEERRQLLEVRASPPPGGLLHELFESQAARTPDAVAVVSGGRELTYAALDRAAGSLARRLRRLGIGPEKPVAVCVERSADILVGLLGVLKACGAYVPLDPSLPEERLAFLLEDSGAAAIVTQPELAGRWSSAGPPVIVVEDGDAPPAWAEPGGMPGTPPESLAYVIYTSGSTGRPKAVGVAHAEAVSHCRTVIEAYELAAGDRVLQFASASFDVSIEQMLPPLAVGATLVLRGNELLAPRDLSLWMARQGLTVANFPTAVWHRWVQDSEALASASPSLRLVIAGGEEMLAEAVRLWERSPLAGVRLLNAYGPTEAVITATLHEARSEKRARIPIGEPLAGRSVRVVDRKGHLVPRGVEGELSLGGPLARGYLGHPDLTAERFVPDPSGAPGARLYRSGDLARLLSDGGLEFLGRVDHQVKIRGFRIELGEIEAVLHGHPGIREAAVTVLNEGSGGARLVAYAVGEGCSSGDLRSWLRERLPEHMVPATWVFLPSLPLSVTGKVDRRALPLPAEETRRGEDPASPSGFFGPAGESLASPFEEMLQVVWEQILDVREVGPESDFFELGGHSLLAIQVASRIREAFGVDLPLRRFFELPQLRGQAAEIERVMSRGRPEAAMPIEPVSRELPLPLSFAQQRLWFLDQLEPGGSAYNITAALRLGGRLDVAALERSLDEIVRRHETLRTTFEPTGDGPVQVIAPACARELPQADLGDLPREIRDRECRRFLALESARPFDLRRGPVFETTLVRLAHREHVLVVRMHHIVSDAWSREIFVSELVALYSAFSQGLPSPLPELPIQYGDFAHWQRLWLTGAERERQLGYWRGRLANAPATLELPTDRPRLIRSSRGGRVPVDLPQSLSEALAALGRRRGVTLFMVLLTAFQTLLHRYSGQDDLSIGTPIAGRTRREVERLIGFFVNTLVLRADLADDPPFQKLLDQARETALGAFAHQDLPFEQLVRELSPERWLDRTPLFQVVLALHTASSEGVELSGPDVRPLEVENWTAKFDLTLAMGVRGGKLSGWAEYPSDVFDRPTIQRLVRHLESLLCAAVADPSGRLSELPLMSGAETAQVLVEWNARASAYPRDSCIHELFELRAEQRPEAIAVAFGDEGLSYRELDEQSNRLARRLRRLGVGPDVLVGLCVSRSADLIVSILGILKAGGAYVPLDPSYPRERLAFMLEDTGVALLLAGEPLAPSLPESGARLLLLEQLCREAVGESSHRLDNRTVAENLAYVMYTSGSTGKPNGVAVNHRGVVRLVRSTSYADFSADQVFLQLAPSSFDASTLEIWGALLNGGRLAVFPPEAASLQSLAEALESLQVTTLWLTAGLFQQMVDDQLPALARLRQLLAGGDVLAVSQVRRMLQEAPGCRLINGYGPTENTTFTCCHPMSGVEQVGRTVAIGRPIANTEVFLLGRRMEPVPVGITGEIYIAGDGLARGYWRRPGLTAERFVPHPQSERPGERLYRTGDLARWLPDGRIEFLGRHDHQVKLRGFRVELGEVESAAARHPDVAEAVALVRDDGGDRRLVCYVVPPAGRQVEGASVRAFLREWVPEHLIPSVVVPLASLPLTSNGKVDRRALPPPGRTFSGLADDFVAPETSAERQVAGIWSALLDVERIGLRDSFFELGGHSLLATRVISRVSETFGVNVTLRQFFENPTVEALARAVEELAPQGEEPLLRQGASVEQAPLSFAQQRLWFLDQLEPASATYNVPVAVRLHGRLDGMSLQRALSEIVRRHEVLRTSFRIVAGDPVQAAAPAEPLPLPVADLRGLPPELRDAEGRRRVAAECSRPFDLTAAPLIRALLVRLDDGDHVLSTVTHHIASDGWSISILIRELSALYAAFTAGLPSPLPELPIQYADFARWQRRQLRGAALESEVAWWKERLGGAPSLQLATDRPYPAVFGPAGAVRPLVLGPRLSGDLLALGKRLGVTPFVLLLAAFEALLHRYTGQEDLTVGTPIAGRRRIEVEELIGFFINTLVLRGSLGGDPPFLKLLAQTREVTLEAYTHQDLPFEKLVEALEPERRLDRTPLFQVMLAFQNAPRERLDLPGLELSPFRMEGRTAKFDLTLSLLEGKGGISGTLEYRTDLFDPSTAARLLGHFIRLLEGVTADPGSRLSELPLLSDPERAQVLVEWNDSELEAEWLPVHESFERQAALRPEAVALVCDGQRLSYGQLDGQASRLARRLRLLGVGPDVPVGLCMARSADLVVAILGILKAGGAYVPLDPGYPRERLAMMIDDTRPPVILADPPSAASLPEHGARVVRPGDVEPAGPPAAVPWRGDVRVEPENLSYLIFTSGSTGRPKGVMVRHGGTAALVRWAGGAFSRDELGGMLASTSINFDLSVFEILVPLALGGKVILARDVLHLPTLPAAGEVRLVNTTPSAIAELVRGRGVPRSVRTVNLAGEALLGSLVDRVYQQTAATALWNLYGPSEDTTYSTSALIAPASGPPTIGRPLTGRRVYLLDRRMSPVPAGVAGELYLAGEGLARGYWNQPGLTAERFVPDPFAPRPGGRLYRTGDLVRAQPDGLLDFLGRIDYQVKVRGFRIELAEVESALAGHPALSEVAVVPRGESDERRIVAYLVAARPQAAPSAGELRAFLRERLPDYMIPSLFVPLEALPLNPNGKIDRKALPDPGAHVPRASDEAAAMPRTWAQELVAEIWTRILGRAPGPLDNFFDLGGHSLLAVRVISRVRETFGVELPVRAMFEAPTLAAFTAEVERGARAGAGVQAPPILPTSRREPLSLSFAQLRLWFLQRLEPESPAYNMPVATRLGGRLDVAALAAALVELVRTHEILRTTYEERDGEPVQVIAPAGPVGLPIVDLAALPRREREARGRELLAAESAMPFRLDTGPLLRLLLIRLGAEDHILSVSTHHIASDGWSLGIFLRELTSLYTAAAAGAAAPLSPLPIQYADFAAWQRAWLQGEVLAGEIAYWRERLAGAPSCLDLPTDRPRPPVPSSHGASLPLSLPLAGAFLDLGRKNGATPFMTLLAAFQVLLGRWSGQEDVSVGVPVAGRNRFETENLIGCFVNTLVLRSRPDGHLSFTELLAHVRESALGAQQHQDVPFEKLVEELQPQRTLGRSPLFQAMFALQNLPRPAREAVPDLRWSALASEVRTSKFDLAMTLGETSGGVRGVIEYSSDLFDRSTVARLSGHFETLLLRIVDGPDRRLASLSLLSEPERHQALAEWGHGPVCRGSGRMVHHLFARQAARTPEATALELGDERLTYHELDLRSSRLANRLRSLGVGPEVVVAISGRRSLETMVGLLGILKAGGACLPLDPVHPFDRLAFLLGDAAPRVLLADSGMEDLARPEMLVLRLGALAEETAGESDTAPMGKADPDALAYVFYTSGSTGRPKGVQVRHGSLASYAESAGERFALAPGDRMLQFASLGFDTSAEEIYSCLTRGATLVLRDETTLASAATFFADVARRGITVLDLPTAYWHQLTADLGDTARIPASLRLVVLGGERAMADRLAEWRARVDPDVRLVNTYGPTEATIVATSCELTGPTAVVAEPEVPIGRAVCGAEIYVLDRDLQPVPAAVDGELYLAGAGLARGYLGRPELTAERFLPHPFSGVPGERLYHTGDLARFRPDGLLEFRGRADHQVKIRGFRIELGEIETALRSHPAVQEAVVVASEHASGPRLTAYLAHEGAWPPEAHDPAAFLRRTLPEYMVPNAFVHLASLPLTPSGKVDRRSLPAPEATSTSGAGTSLAPRDSLELALAGLWEALLERSPVGVQEDFFVLGGHSLLAVRLVGQIRRRFGVELPLSVLFQSPTIEALATRLRGMDTGLPASPVATLQPAGSGAPLFLVHPIGGNVFCYLNLVRHMGRRHPVHALQSGSNGEEEGREDLEAMAARYVRELRKIQPSGPYRLGGWSYGGVVAFEMARQLETAGLGVALLALIDSEPPAPRSAEPGPDEAALLLMLCEDLEGMSRRRLGVTREALLALDPAAGLDLVLERAVGTGVLPADAETGDLRRLVRIFQGNLRRLYGYRPEPCKGKITLFRAEESPEQRPGCSWEGLTAAGVEVHVVPGNHFTALQEPRVRDLAGRLASRLDGELS